MALTQSALRVPGPSWGEEVVPALRKRLQSESRTLSKRMSAISLSGDDVEAALSNGGDLNTSSRQKPSTSEAHHYQPQQQQYHYQQRQPNGSSSLDYSSGSATASASSHRTPHTAKKPTPNGSSTSSSSTSFQRSRTYSQPDLPNNSAKMNRSTNGPNSSSRSARPSDPKPTRIPKPSRAYNSYSNGNTPVVPQTNGFTHSPDYTTEQGQYQARAGTSSQFTSYSSRSTVGIPQNRSTPGLLTESPPFPPSSSASSIAYTPTLNGHGYHDYANSEEGEIDATPSRGSMDSEEQPFEHWYRGEVSRNGGVGELRVGRRQEMLEIANYGHMIRDHANVKRKVSPGWGQGQVGYRTSAEDQAPQSGGRGRHRKRAGSIAGLTEADRVRGSVFFDEEGMDAVARVLDESPLTDFEDDHNSDVASLASYHRVNHAYIPGVGDISTTSTTTAGRSRLGAQTPTNDTSEDADCTPRIDDRSTTPTPLLNSQHTQTSRSGQYPPSRIPGPSRRSSESRAATPTMNNASRSMNASTSSSSKTPSPPPIPTSGGVRSVSGQSLSSGQLNAGKRGVSPAAPGAKRRVPVKSLRGKQTPVTLPKKDPKETASQYPSMGEDGDDMADAIPSWTQPVPREGNWDEVVLPVVARNKGMGEHYETADGSPQPKKPTETRIAPAPGTFGFNPSKYRVRHSDEFIPLDEFGQPAQPISEEKQPDEQGEGLRENAYDRHDQTRLPARGTPRPSPPPFSHYAPRVKQVVASNGHVGSPPDIGQRPNNQVPDDAGAGCCKCTVM